jgi:hypothetical protein
MPADMRSDRSDYDKEAYKSYMMRAVYTNFTGRTVDGLVGGAYRKPPVIDLSGNLEYLKYDADGAGQSIEQLSKDVLSSLMGSGREVLLVDYPAIEEGLTAEEEKELSPQAHINRYDCESLINWKTENRGGRDVLTLAVLAEEFNDSEDEFKHENKKRYRVLRLTDRYSQQIYVEKDGKFEAEEEIFPTKSNGDFWNVIPLFIVGSQNNDASVDRIPMEDIANVNVAHFRNSADLEENCFIHGQLTLGVTSSMSNEQFKEANPNGISVGGKAGHFLGEQGGFTSVQADPNQLADKLMERKEDQMRKLGAKMIEQRTGTQTAEAARIDATGESSVLSDLVSNVEEAFQRCIAWCGEFMGEEVDEREVFKSNREFFDASVDPQAIIASIQLSDRGIIANKDVLNLARKANMIDPDRTDEEIEGEAETDSPLDDNNQNPIKDAID